jgi:hypothetical protein
MKDMATNSKGWEEIEQHYIDLNEKGWHHEKLLELCKHIRFKYSSSRLFAYTSLDTLVVSNTDLIEYKRETLHIQFLRQEDEWLFEYFSQPFRPAEFKRNYPADIGIEKFDNFIKMINW